MPSSGFDDIFQIISDLSLEKYYLANPTAIDWILSFIFFLGITSVVIKRMFPGNAGTAVSVSISLILSTGYSLLARSMNISLASFGPLAVFILIFFVGTILYSLLRHIGAAKTTALAGSYVLMYLSFKMVSPGIFDWIAGASSLLNGALLLGFLFAAGKLVLSVFKRRKMKPIIENTLNSALDNSERELKEYSKETLKEGKEIIRMDKKTLKSSEHLKQYITRIIDYLEQYGNTEEGRKEISKAIKGIQEEEHYIISALNKVKNLNSKLAKLDEASFSKLKTEYNSSAGKAKRELKEKLEFEEEKLKIEQACNEIGNKIITLYDSMNSYLNNAVNTIRAGGYISDAKDSLIASIQIEDQIEKELLNIKRIEKILLKYTKEELL